ncbi:AAA family ATPase [Pontibacter roseus]|uniref:AAA family ATPase n=1 Tax=Pontibacter roseus TaxID=336989 RepID=UPI000380AE56|nr:AAA family ATPase [Pontibacter roseus]
MDKLNPTFNFTAIGLDEIKADAEQLANYATEVSENNGLFSIRTANRWIEQAKKRPIPRKLFDVFFHEGEICILFADTNLGKSILAVQIGNSISTGEHILGFRLEAPKQKILYFDFELSDKQFEVRYSLDFAQHYNFDSNFYRAEINPDAAYPDAFPTFENYLNYSLDKSIVETGAKVLIIDNLTYLKNETEKAKDALPLMKHLKALKSKYGLSVLVLAHTPKRDLSKPLTRNDLSGSKMLMNFCDSAFAIGESHSDKNIRYIKQIKARNTEIVYDADNVALCQVTKDLNFLQFEFMGMAAEREHLREHTEKDRDTIIEKAKELSQQGKSQRQIATELSISLGAVNKYLKS